MKNRFLVFLLITLTIHFSWGITAGNSEEIEVGTPHRGTLYAIMQSNIEYFEFRSGGAYHIEGFGEWVVVFGLPETINIKHNVRGEIEDFGDFSLTEEEGERSMSLINALDIPNMESSTRDGLPDEVQYIFILIGESGERKLRSGSTTPGRLMRFSIS